MTKLEPVRLFLVLNGLVGLGLATVAVAQMPKLPRAGGGPEDDYETPQPPVDSSILVVRGTRPITLPNKRWEVRHIYEPRGGQFRMAFRVMSPSGSVPFSTIGYGGFRSEFVLGWRAFSSSGARCVMVRNKLYGVDAYSGGTVGAADSMRQMLEEDAVGTIASPTRATIITADFSCDSPISAGDKVSVQIKFFARGPRGWKTANYSFDDLQVGSPR